MDRSCANLCTYIAVFLCGVRRRHNRAPNLEPRQLFIDLVTVSTCATGPDVLCNALNISPIHLYVAPQDLQNCGRNFAKRKQSDAEFAGNRAYYA